MKPNPVASIVNGLCPWHILEAAGQPLFSSVASRGIPGWSTPLHGAFFEVLVQVVPNGGRILLCGVYHGMDLALIQGAAKAHGRDIELVGVDLFSSGPMADWTDEQRKVGTWEGNGFGPPPSIDAARRNAPGAVIVQGDAAEFMAQSVNKGRFGAVVLDTSHDEKTLRREIPAAKHALAPGGVISGDDYTGPSPAWGVDRAVSALLPHHVVFGNRIWLAQFPQ